MHPVNVGIINMWRLTARYLPAVVLAEALKCSKCFIDPIAGAKTSALNPSLSFRLHYHKGSMATII
jgi:hypothetical protein